MHTYAGFLGGVTRFFILVYVCMHVCCMYAYVMYYALCAKLKSVETPSPVLKSA